MPIDLDLINRYGLEPESPAERAAAAQVDIRPADFSIYRTKLELICEEAKELLVRMGVSDMIQAQDCIVGIYTAQGDLSVASVGTYLHTATGVIPIKYIRQYFEHDPTVGLRDGDNFFANEAIYGGIHNPDQINLLPVYYQGELIAWTGAAAHETETGAAEPGGYTLAARSRYEEGIKFPPIKIGENFQLRRDVLDAILNHVRDPHMLGSDMRARTAAAMRARERLLEMAAERGAPFVVRLLRMLTTYAADTARRRVAALNDGIYRHTTFFDARGVDEALGRVGVTVIKRGDRIVIDLNGSSPPTRSYVNAFPHQVRATLASALSMFMFADLPASSGMLAPFVVRAPAGTVVNPPLDTAIGGTIRICPIIVNGVYICLAKMLYDSEFRDRCAVLLGASSRTFMHGGINQHGWNITGNMIHVLNATGLGARSHGDGVDAAGFYYSGLGDSLDTEHLEMQQPFLYLNRKVAVDQYGFGKYRGGAGASVTFVLHGTPAPYRLVHAPVTHHVTADPGLFGAYAGPPCPAIVVDARCWQERAPGDGWPTSMHDLLHHRWFQEAGQAGALPPQSLPAGTIVAIAACSGGGYGDPLDREPAAVLADLRAGVLSPASAEHVYRVALDPATGEVDVAMTERLRAAERADRLRRGVPYAEFARTWEQRRPPAEILGEYGPWPYAITEPDVNPDPDASTEGSL